MTEEQYHKNYDEIDTLTKSIRFKYNRLNEGNICAGFLYSNQFMLDLISYLRAHCLVMYEGPNFQQIKMTEPTVLEFEIVVLD